MDSQEKNLITNFFERVSAQNSNRALPPVDPEANQLIVQELKRNPDAPYRITQLAVIQEAALARANQRIQQLEAQLQQTQGQRGGLFSGLFGRRQAPQRPMGAPYGYGAPGYFPSSGSGFLGSALTTAAGVAGGIMAADALESMFSGHHDAGAVSGADSFTDPTDPFSGSGTEVQGYDDTDFGGGFDDFGSGFDDDSMF